MKHFTKFLNETYHAKDKACQEQDESPWDIIPENKIKTETTEDNNLTSFMRSGLVVLSVILLAGIAVAYGNKNNENLVTSVFSNRISNKELPIYCVDTPEKKIALSFDAAWGNEDTQKILDILKKNDVHVTFFMTGGWVAS